MTRNSIAGLYLILAGESSRKPIIMKQANSKSKTTLKRKQKESEPPKLSKLQDDIWSEQYCNEDYCKTAEGNEFYARASNEEEFFNTKATTIRYARKKRRVASGLEQEIEFPPRQKDGHVLLPEPPKNKTTGNRAVIEYDKDASGLEVYPKDTNGNEYYLKDENENDRVIKHGNIEMYAKLADNKQQYPKDSDGNEIPISMDGNKKYARDKDDNEYYPKDVNGDETIHKIWNLWYACDKDSNEFYPKLNDGAERYLDREKEEFPAKNASNIAFYAKNESQGEFYPKKYMDSEGDLVNYMETINAELAQKKRLLTTSEQP